MVVACVLQGTGPFCLICYILWVELFILLPFDSCRVCSDSPFQFLNLVIYVSLLSLEVCQFSWYLPIFSKYQLCFINFLYCLFSVSLISVLFIKSCLQLALVSFCSYFYWFSRWKRSLLTLSPFPMYTLVL